MDRILYSLRFIMPISSIMAVILCFIIQAPIPVTAGLIIFALVCLLNGDPFNAFEKILAPQSRHIITSCMISVSVICYAYYYIPDLHPGIAVFICCLGVILLYTAYRLNSLWLQHYLALDCREVSCALVSDENKEYKYIRYWEKKGRRICRSLLDMHLHRKIEDHDMENTIRPAFIAGMAAGDEYSDELLANIEILEQKLEQAEKKYEKLENSINTEAEKRAKTAVQTEQLRNKQLREKLKLAEDALKTAQTSLKEKGSLERDLTIKMEWIRQLECRIEELEKELQDAQTSMDGVTLDDLRNLQDDLKREQIMLDSSRNYANSLLDENEYLKQQLDEALQRIDILEDSSDCHLVPVHILSGGQEQNHAEEDLLRSGGRPAALSKQQVASLLADRHAGGPGASYDRLAKKYNVSKSTVARICKTAQAEQPQANVI